MTVGTRQIATAALLAAFLAGCASAGRDDVADPGISAEPQEPQGMSAGQISKLLAGKSWRFKGPNNSGVTLYAEDGTSLVDVDGKGTTTGNWSAKDGLLCESFAPAPFIPKGVPESCYPFSGANGQYKAGKATFTPA
jgi:hypothetical protein